MPIARSNGGLSTGWGWKRGIGKRLDAGTRQHARKAVAERLAGGAIGIGKMIVIVAVLMLPLWLVWR
jgi:hypothetical protein